MKNLISTALGGLALFSGACSADVINIEWGTDARFAKEVTIAPGKFAEVCGKLPAKAVVPWSFEADARLDFNVHYHEGKKVSFPAKVDGSTQANGVLNVGVAQDFCWMWSNKTTSEAKLKFDLKRESGG